MWRSSRYQAVLAVIGEGRTVTEVARSGASRGRRSMRGWLSMRLVVSKGSLMVRGVRSRVRTR